MRIYKQLNVVTNISGSSLDYVLTNFSVNMVHYIPLCSTHIVRDEAIAEITGVTKKVS